MRLYIDFLYLNISWQAAEFKKQMYVYLERLFLYPSLPLPVTIS